MSTPKIYAAMISVMQDIKAIGKDKQTTGFANFKYRGIDDVYNALNPILAQHGVLVVPELLEMTREERVGEKKDKYGNPEQKLTAFVVAKVKYTFYAEDGSSVSCVVAGEGMDSGDKATPKALSIAMKYALFQTFCIPTEDMPDPDAETDRFAPRPKEQVQAIREAAAASNPDPLTTPQLRALMARFRERGVGEAEAYLRDLSDFFGRKIETTKALTQSEFRDYMDATAPAPVNDNPF